MCRISVIMGAYNVQNLWIFEKAINSVLRQTMQDFELIVCDDGSTDNTYQMLRRFARQDRRIRVIRSQKRCGLAAALNRCLFIARGDLIARQDADDLSMPDRFRQQAAFLERHPQISFVGTNVTLFYQNGSWGKRVLPPRPKKEDFLFTCPFVHGSLLFRREAFMRAGVYRTGKQTLRAEDYDLLMRMYAAGLRGANLQKAHYQFLEDQTAWKRRKYRYRFDEAIVRLYGFRQLGLLPKGLPYVVKPLAVGLVPPRILLRLKNGYTIQM